MWNVAVMPWLYRSLTLDFEDTKSVLTARLLKTLLKTDNLQPAYCRYVQNLNIKMPSSEGDNFRRRLKPGVLKVLARLVPMLPMLKSFTFVSTLTPRCAPLFSNANTGGKFRSQCRDHYLKRFTNIQSCLIEQLSSRAGV